MSETKTSAPSWFDQVLVGVVVGLIVAKLTESARS